MYLGYVLGLYLILIMLMFAFFYRSGLTAIASLLLSLILGQIILNIMKRPQHVQSAEDIMDGHISSSLILYLAPQFLTPIITVIMAVVYAVKDKRSHDLF
jgi:hypothetical protein